MKTLKNSFVNIIRMFPFRWGIKVISTFEGSASGIQFSNMFQRFEPKDPINMGSTFGMFLLEIFIFSLLAWYIDKVRPGQYGVAQKWYFLVQVCGILK